MGEVTALSRSVGVCMYVSVCYQESHFEDAQVAFGDSETSLAAAKSSPLSSRSKSTDGKANEVTQKIHRQYGRLQRSNEGREELLETN